MRHLLIVEDDPSLRRALTTALAPFARTVSACSNVAAAREKLPTLRPDFLVLDVSLPDGTAFDVLDAVHALAAMPIVVAISGNATADQSFRLAQRGVRAFVPKPLDLALLERTVTEVMAEPPDLIPHLRGAVGHASVLEVERVVRKTMLSEALGRTRGSKSGAARILHVSRQLLQHMVRGALS